MQRRPHFFDRTRREFLTTTASGLGGMALGAMLTDEGLLCATETAKDSQSASSLVRTPHFEPKAKACIFIFMAGAPSQLDLFDPKPKLNELHGQPLPQSILEQARFAFIKPDTATLMGSPRRFRKYGQCGMEFSDWLPHLGSAKHQVVQVQRQPPLGALHELLAAEVPRAGAAPRGAQQDLEVWPERPSRRQPSSSVTQNHDDGHRLAFSAPLSVVSVLVPDDSAGTGTVRCAYWARR